MTQEKFIEYLDKKGYVYSISGDTIIFNNVGDVGFSFISETLPSGIEFNNKGSVHLRGIETLPSGIMFNNIGNVYLTDTITISSGVQFNNKGTVDLKFVKTLPSHIVFNNTGSIRLNYLKTINPGVVFNNKDSIHLDSIIGGDDFYWWVGNIKGIDSKRLLNLMIKQRVFI